MIDAQLELTFETRRNRSSLGKARRPAPNTRRWWFERMREIVDRACDWQPAPFPQPEQTSFGMMDRHLAIATLAVGSGQEQLVCE